MTDQEKRNFRIQEQDFPDLRQHIYIEACAVWDTVSARGIPTSFTENVLNPYGQSFRVLNMLRKTPTIGTEALPPRLKNAFHAVALNEFRGDFKPILWAGSSATANISQCWFLGSHSDIGGGYEECWLSNITLIWMVARLRKYTRLTISDERLKQYLHPTGLSNPRDNVFIVHQDDPSIAQRSEDPHPDIRAGIRLCTKALLHYILMLMLGLVNNSFEGKYALGSMRFRAPGGLITKHKALNRGTDGARKQELGNIEDPATDTTVQQTVHSSVRILMKKAKATSAVMEFRKTEISSQEDDSLGMKSRHVA